jgi:hypothetical protein
MIQTKTIAVILLIAIATAAGLVMTVSFSTPGHAAVEGNYHYQNDHLSTSSESSFDHANNYNLFYHMHH